MQYTQIPRQMITLIEAEIDKFVWNWAMRGIGILKIGWSKKYSKIVDVVKTSPVIQIVIGPDGNESLLKQ